MPAPLPRAARGPAAVLGQLRARKRSGALYRTGAERLHLDRLILIRCKGLQVYAKHRRVMYRAYAHNSTYDHPLDGDSMICYSHCT